MTTQYEEVHTGEFILWEDDEGRISREAIVLKSGQKYKVGQVLGKITSGGAILVGTTGGGSPTSTVTFGGTGNGTLTFASARNGAGIQAGNYLVRQVEALDQAKFEIVRPDGTVDGYANAGVAYDGQIKFTLAQGSTVFVDGDTFTVPVTISGDLGKYTVYNNSASDGTQIAAAILYQATDATSTDQIATGIVRLAEVVGSLLIGLDDAARADFLAVNIIVR